MPLSTLAQLWLNLRKSRWPVLVVVSLVVSLVFVAIENRSQMLKTIANDDKLDSIPDSHVTGYDPSWLQMYLSKLDQNGRNHYIHSVLLIDCFFPVTYGFWLCLALSKSFAKLDRDYIKFRFVLFLPFLAVVFDYLENFMLFMIFSDFQRGFSEQKADIASVFTQLKWCSVLASFIAMAIGIITSIRDVKMNLHRSRRYHRP